MEISRIRLLKAVSRRADNTIGKSKTKQKQKQKQIKTNQNKQNKKRQTMILKTIYRKPKIEQHEPSLKTQVLLKVK